MSCSVKIHHSGLSQCLSPDQKVKDIIEPCKTNRADIQRNADNLNNVIPKFEKPLLVVDEDEKNEGTDTSV